MATLEDRLLAVISDIGSDIKTLTASVSQVFKNITQTVDATNENIGNWTIQDDGSSSSNWPDKFVVWYRTLAGASRRVFYLNERGEPRVTPAMYNTVAFRVFTKELASDPARDTSQPIMELMDDRTTRTSLWRVMPDGTPYILDQPQRLVTWDEGNQPANLSTYPSGTWYGVRPSP